MGAGGFFFLVIVYWVLTVCRKFMRGIVFGSEGLRKAKDMLSGRVVERDLV